MIETLDMSWIVFAILCVIAFLSAAVKNFSAMGFGLTFTPALMIFAPTAVPAVALLLVMPLGVILVTRGRREIDQRSTSASVLGGAVGTIGGGIVLAGVATEIVTLAAGGAILLALVTLTTSPRMPHASRWFQSGSGFCGGLVTVTSGTGGPFYAMPYLHETAARARATLAAVFLVGQSLALGTLVVSGRVSGAHLALSLALLPMTLAGVAASERLFTRVSDRCFSWVLHAVIIGSTSYGMIQAGTRLATG